MCGRYTQTATLKQLMLRFGVEREEIKAKPRYNIAPSQEAPVVIQDGERRLVLMRWGLIPHWAKDEKIGYRLINARAETVTQKPSYRKPFQRSRCLVAVDGFYEWQKQPGTPRKRPHRIVMKDREPFGLAGLWDRWKDPAGKEVQSFTIITTSPNPMMKPIQDRMPAILSRKDEEKWLDPEFGDTEKLHALLGPYPEAEMEAYEVSTAVNSPKNDTPSCVEPVQA